MLLALLLTLGQVRVELAPADDVVAWRVERSDGAGWRPVAHVAAAGPGCCVFETSAPSSARLRIIGLDAVGNESPPTEVPASTWSCSWTPFPTAGAVPIDCPRCNCELARARLDEAVRWLLEHQLVDGDALMLALGGLRVAIAPTRVLDLADGTKVEGVFAADRYLVVLTMDGSAALHELLHVAQVAAGVADGPGGHGSWENGAVKELDERFRYQHRGRSLWARPSR